VLGRETALQRVEWVDGWPRVAGGVPSLDVPAPDLPPSPWPPRETWSTLRRPASPDWIVTEGSRARIQGGQSPHGLRAPSLYAHRMTAERCALRTTMEFRPGDVHQSAGVTAYYNTRNWHYLSVGPDGLTLTISDRGARTVQLLLSDPPARLALGVERDGAVLRFSCDTGDGWTVLREADATILSDENADEFVDGQVRVFGFTGAFLGLWVQDLSAEGCHAEFDEIVYEA
jgi:xylan 1,4-beta-xylosidase